MQFPWVFVLHLTFTPSSNINAKFHPSIYVKLAPAIGITKLQSPQRNQMETLMATASCFSRYIEIDAKLAPVIGITKFLHRRTSRLELKRACHHKHKAQAPPPLGREYVAVPARPRAYRKPCPGRWVPTVHPRAATYSDAVDGHITTRRFATQAPSLAGLPMLRMSLKTTLLDDSWCNIRNISRTICCVCEFALLGCIAYLSPPHNSMRFA